MRKRETMASPLWPDSRAAVADVAAASKPDCGIRTASAGRVSKKRRARNAAKFPNRDGENAMSLDGVRLSFALGGYTPGVFRMNLKLKGLRERDLVSV